MSSPRAISEMVPESYDVVPRRQWCRPSLAAFVQLPGLEQSLSVGRHWQSLAHVAAHQTDKVAAVVCMQAEPLRTRRWRSCCARSSYLSWDRCRQGMLVVGMNTRLQRRMVFISVAALDTLDVTPTYGCRVG